MKRFEDPTMLSRITDPAKEHLALYWRRDTGKLIGSLGGLKAYLATRGRKLIFATNGGMYRPDHSPVGLYIEDFKTLSPLVKGTGEGNFYLLPNGVFYLTKERRAVVCTTTAFRSSPAIQFATQSGPMLLIDGQIHPAFKQGSTNLNIRSGVGILPDGRVLFAMSKSPVNLYDFAIYFQRQGCQNALYLDGFVSRMYLSEENFAQGDGYFGVLIGVDTPE